MTKNNIDNLNNESNNNSFLNNIKSFEETNKYRIYLEDIIYFERKFDVKKAKFAYQKYNFFKYQTTKKNLANANDKIFSDYKFDLQYLIKKRNNIVENSILIKKSKIKDFEIRLNYKIKKYEKKSKKNK
ncbi:MAG: hypothetical protein K4H23_03495, partial [Mollicutes bacterium PWAP]|nr:hypothetical protein [Mollicutes bacterium PWAP]